MVGRPISCDCGKCLKCRRRDYMRSYKRRLRHGMPAPRGGIVPEETRLLLEHYKKLLEVRV